MAQQQATTSQPPPHAGKRRVTMDEYLRLLDTQPHEVIDGELIAMAPQSFKSSWVGHVLYGSLLDFTRGKDLGMVLMETAYSLEVDGSTNWVVGSLVPDVSFMRREQVQRQIDEFGEGGTLRFPPDLVVEIVSPTDSFSDVNKKVSRYLDYGVRLVIVLDPQRRAAHLYSPQERIGRVLADGDMLDGADALPGWTIAIKDLFDSKPV